MPANRLSISRRAVLEAEPLAEAPLELVLGDRPGLQPAQHRRAPRGPRETAASPRLRRDPLCGRRRRSCPRRRWSGRRRNRPAGLCRCRCRPYASPRWATRLPGRRHRTGSTGPGSKAWFAANVDGAEPPLAFERISGGRSNLTYEVPDAAGRRWALRRPPLGKRLGSAHDMGREHRVISALAPTAVPVPPVVGLCEDEAVNDAPFYVMEFVEGPILRSPSRGRGVPRAEADRRAIGERVVDTLVDDPRRRSRRGRPRRAGQEVRLRRPPAAPLARAVGEVEDPRAGGRRRGPRPPRRRGSPSRARRRSSTATTGSTT